MISGLKAREYEDRLVELGLTTLEERRHQADMAMVYKVLTGKEQVDPTEWFNMAGETARATRATADPLNIRVKHGRLELRQNFFTVRVTEQWNQVPTDIKKLRTVDAFKVAYAQCPPPGQPGVNFVPCLEYQYQLDTEQMTARTTTQRCPAKGPAGPRRTTQQVQVSTNSIIKLSIVKKKTNFTSILSPDSQCNVVTSYMKKLWIV